MCTFASLTTSSITFVQCLTAVLNSVLLYGEEYLGLTNQEMLQKGEKFYFIILKSLQSHNKAHQRVHLESYCENTYFCLFY